MSSPSLAITSVAAISTSTIYLLYLAINGTSPAAFVMSGTSYSTRISQGILAGVVAGLLAALARWTTEPRRRFLGHGIIVGPMSIIGPLTRYAAGGNQLVLALMRGLAAIAIVATILPRIPLDRS